MIMVKALLDKSAMPRELIFPDRLDTTELPRRRHATWRLEACLIVVQQAAQAPERQAPLWRPAHPMH
jgi:hypothetical protein